ncbi:MAG TPA: MSMEG_1061 family FMN-dependent PPOX-type flavoprotein [Acidimicrobiales bacterium]|nr:MSMEG_1061 family FMN-dependent PPOX-type flavoprotein [Acidimicrobiales bacterium]
MATNPNPFRLTTEAEVTAILGEPPGFVLAKISDRVDASAASFIARSPLVFVGTVDRDGGVDVSPKGDAPGFVHVTDQGSLLIPERKGNNLAFGPHNILATGRIGLVFVVPGQRETLRVNGAAALDNDPALLEQLSARGKPSLLCTEVRVEECFFHCGKSMIRSRAWDPDSWNVDGTSLMVDQVVDALGGDPALVPIVNAQVEQNYIDDL